MAAFTASVTGNWSNTATWGGSGPPGASDTATINSGITVTVTASVSVGNNQANASATGAIAFTDQTSLLVINTGVTLTLTGPLLLNSAGGSGAVAQVTMNAGAILVFDSSVGGATVKYDIRPASGGGFERGVFTCSGTSGSHCKIYGKGATRSGTGGNAWYNNNGAGANGYISATYTEFYDFGDATNQAWNINCQTGFSGMISSFSHCSFAGCGQINATTNYAAGNSPVSFSYVRTSGELGTYALNSSLYQAMVIDNCSFDKVVQITPQSGNTATVTNNAFAGSYINGSSVAVGTWDNNVVAILVGNQNVQAIGASTTGNYYAVNNSGGGSSFNGHWVANPPTNANFSYTGDVFDTNATDTIGDAILNTTSSGAITITVKKCLLLPNSAGAAPGKFISPINGADNNTTWVIEHNTFVSGHVSEQVGVTYGETNAGYAGQYTDIKSNLAWSTTASDCCVFTRQAGSTQNVVTGGATSVDYNGKWNPYAAGSDGSGYHATVNSATKLFTSDTGLGANDVTVGSNPFLDSTRNMGKWATSLGGTGTITGAFTLLANRIDITVAGNAAATPSALLAWVRAGFQVTNAALINAGHDGATIGAMPYLPPVVQTFLTSGTTWAVPNDWNSNANTIECIGGGGAGDPGVGSTQAGAGGGGGAYSAIVNQALTPGSTVTIQVGAGGATANANGTDTLFKDNTSTTVCLAKGGQGGQTTSAGGAGGASGSGTGTTKNSGGAGGTSALLGGGCGGGGAGGPLGIGGAGGASTTVVSAGGGGGGGNGGGTAGASPSGANSAGGAGGNNFAGTGSGAGGAATANGTVGTIGGGGGGGGGTAASAGSGANGGAGTEWDATHGSGGGGGAQGGTDASGTTGNGALYGGGGAGSSTLSSAFGTGAAGIIVITYTRTAFLEPPFNAYQGQPTLAQ
jgi:hypothetical protein